MRIVDVIEDKRNGKVLTKEQIEFFVENYTNGNIPDYQASALIMAIFLNGINDEESINLTMAMANSGEILDLSAIEGIKVDKHSTGGVGDKTTLVIGPLAASCGVPIVKMSGRALGFTGGTIDKFESFNGIRLDLTPDEFIKQVNEIKIAEIEQTKDLAPADKKIYALRDTTATVENIGLIASSIMSKKIASGCDGLVLDVKVGSGAFMKNVDDARKLADLMVRIGKGLGKRTIALLTNMDIPLGRNIGNILEVKEAIEVLNNRGNEELKNICISLATYMVMIGKNLEYDEANKLVKENLENGSALNKFKELVRYQGGDSSFIDDPTKFPTASIIYEVKATKNGYISKMTTNEIGKTSMLLGEGRETKDDKIDYTAGIELLKKYGEFVNNGEVIARLHTNSQEKLNNAISVFENAIEISQEDVKQQTMIFDVIQ